MFLIFDPTHKILHAGFSFFAFRLYVFGTDFLSWIFFQITLDVLQPFPDISSNFH